jgi:hypothetical protein
MQPVDEKLLIAVAAQVYGGIAAATMVHSKPENVKDKSIALAVADSVAVARQIIAKAQDLAAFERKHADASLVPTTNGGSAAGATARP